MIVSYMEAFEKLKEIMKTKLVLRLTDLEKPFEIHIDASNKAIGRILV